ncbi:radical SAM protein [Desulfovibrio sp. OttesenSCG-928-G11]|nr:radical SAM protein [Desulfovibrio sp. OttesenSCG-928-G11]
MNLLDKLPCYNPWQQMVVDATTGVVTPCGYWHGNESCGNVHNTSLLEIWNSRVYQRLRKGLATGDLKSAGCVNCYALKQKTNFSLTYDEDIDSQNSGDSPYKRNIAVLKKEVNAGAKILTARPTILSMTFTHKCNIRCLHCCQQETRNLPLQREGIYQETMELIPTLVQLIIGGGEPFADPHWQRFFNEWSNESNPYLCLAVTTNGTLINNAVVNELSRFKHVAFNVSFDGGTKEVYEKIRVGADFDKVLANVDRMKTITDQKGRPSCSGISMSVMKSNLKTLPDFFQMASQHRLLPGLSPVIVLPVHEALTMFNNAKKDTRDWRKALDKAKNLLTNDFLRPLYEANNSRATSGFWDNRYRHIFEAIENSIPWEIIDLPAYEVKAQLPRHILEEARVLRKPAAATSQKMPYSQKPVLVLFPKREDFNVCRYYADLEEDGSWNACLPNDTYRLGIINSMDTPVVTVQELIMEANQGKITFHRIEAAGIEKLKRVIPKQIRPYLKKIKNCLCGASRA